MYGAVTGKVVLFVVVVILCLLSLTRTCFLLMRSGNAERFSVGTVVRLITPFVFVYIAWWLLWK